MTARVGGFDESVGGNDALEWMERYVTDDRAHLGLCITLRPRESLANIAELYAFCVTNCKRSYNRDGSRRQLEGGAWVIHIPFCLWGETDRAVLEGDV